MIFVPKLIIRLAKIIPAPLKSMLKRAGAGKLSQAIWLISGSSPHSFQLSAQLQWVDVLKNNKLALCEYWQRYRYLDEINEICRIGDDTKVLDVGCGISSVLHHLKGQRLGIDPLADEYVKLYKYPDGINIIRGVGENMPFPHEHFDLVLCCDTLDHATNPRKTADEIYRVLKPGGLLILRVWDFWRRKRAVSSILKYTLFKIIKRSKLDFKDVFVPWKNSSGKILIQRYFHCFTKKELENLAREAGFRIKESWKGGKDPRTNIYLIAEK